MVARDQAKKKNKEVVVMRKALFGIIIGLLFLPGCSNPLNIAPNLVFRELKKPIGEALKEHPQVKTVEWAEMPVLGDGVVVAKIIFSAKAIAVNESEDVWQLVWRMALYQTSDTAILKEFIKKTEKKLKEKDL